MSLMLSNGLLCNDPKFADKKDLRIAIAKDVIAQLNVLTVEQNRYLSNWQNNNRFPEVTQENLTETLTKECTVCALGACFLSAMRIEGALPIDTMFVGKTFAPISAALELFKKLEGIFCQQQLDLIEGAFERGMFTRSVEEENRPGQRVGARSFGQSYNNPKDRLRAIMENIIENDGTFCPNEKGAAFRLKIALESMDKWNRTEEEKIERLTRILQNEVQL